MAEPGAINSSADASSSNSQKAPNPHQVTSSARKARATGFLKPDSPRKRRRPGEDSSLLTSTPPVSVNPATPESSKYSVSPPTLTAAQALIDQRKQKHLQQAVSDRGISPNSARTALLALQGKQMVSERGSETAGNATNSAADSIHAVTPAIQEAQVPHVGVAQMQQDAAPAASFELAEETTAGAVIEINGGPVASPGRMDETTGVDEDLLRPSDSQMPRRQETDPGESRSDKALTYPGPLPNFQQADRRRNTHSGFNRESESKSPSSTKKHQCPYCSTTFTRHHNLKSHLLTHSHEKPYYCETCESRFRRLHDLKRHSKLHTGERPHTCPKCHRSFARGDALARHSKGAGGCAGRRSSLGGDEPDPDDSMHGMMFSGEASHEPERMDVDAQTMDSRKGSLPSIKHHDAPNHSPSAAHSSFVARQPSTYPPIAGRAPNPGGLYPPMASPGTGSSTSNSPRQPSFNQPAGSSTFQTSSPNVFAQGAGMTESPKPLSPGSHQLGHPDPAIHRNRSPSLTQQYQQQQFGRRTSARNSPPPMGLPPMSSGGHPGPPHLPSLAGLPPPNPHFTLHSQTGAPSHMHANPQGSGPSAVSPGFHPQSGNNSLSSQSAEGSGQNAYGQGNDRLWAYIRSLEVKVDRLQEEVGSLKSQLSAPR